MGIFPEPLGHLYPATLHRNAVPVFRQAGLCRGPMAELALLCILVECGWVG